MPTRPSADGRRRSQEYEEQPLELEGWPASDDLEQAFAKAAGPIHWPSLQDAELDSAWRELREWVDRLVVRFSLDVRTVPPCWEQHNAIVEALAALRDYERGCYTDTSPPAAAVDFIRALREVQVFLRESAALTQCSAREHRPDPLRPTT